MTRRDCLLFTTALAAPGLQAAESLFNGRDTSGWIRAGNGIWTVEDGALVGRSDHAKIGPGYLFTARDFTDFRLSLEFWITPKGNSGVYVREPLRKWGTKGDERPAHGERRGYEIQIDYNDRKNLTGAVYDVQNASRVAGGEDRWNRMEIECRGPRIRVWVAGEMVNDYSPSRSASGRIGLQIHGGQPHDHVVKFRRIEVAQV